MVDTQRNPNTWVRDRRVPLLLREEAEKRLFSLEKNLLKKPEVARRYKEAMNANVEKGHIRKLESSEAEDGPS